MKKELKALIEELKNDGLKVYYRPSKNVTYIYFTDDKNIGYAEYSLSGIKYNTVHKQSKEYGTGFIIDSLNYKDCFTDPSWTIGYNIVKYKNWNEFHNLDEWNKELILYKTL